ncbi:hypothetical protein BgiBS90_012826, partial [Biomphalaria glabrata]
IKIWLHSISYQQCTSVIYKSSLPNCDPLYCNLMSGESGYVSPRRSSLCPSHSQNKILFVLPEVQMYQLFLLTDIKSFQFSIILCTKLQEKIQAREVITLRLCLLIRMDGFWSCDMCAGLCVVILMLISCLMTFILLDIWSRK